MKNKEHMQKTKEWCQGLSDSELLDLVKKAQGHTTDFQKYLNCDFSYTFLTNVLRSRGYEHGWYKSGNSSPIPSGITTISMKKTNEPIIRQSFMIEQGIAKDWKKFNQWVPYNTVTLGWALRRFMEDTQAGKIKFELDLREDVNSR